MSAAGGFDGVPRIITDRVRRSQHWACAASITDRKNVYPGRVFAITVAAHMLTRSGEQIRGGSRTRRGLPWATTCAAVNTPEQMREVLSEVRRRWYGGEFATQ